MIYIKDTYYPINDLLVEDNEETIDEYTCPICFELYYKKKILQCKEGCICCDDCWLKSLLIKKQCMNCRGEVKSINELSRNRAIEKQLLNKKCYCPYSFTNKIKTSTNNDINNVKDSIDGCNEILKLDDLEAHIEKCQFKFIECDNEGCDKIIRLNKLEQHKSSGECKFQIVVCKDCNSQYSLKKIEQHKSECPDAIIQCNQCSSQIKRVTLDNHIKNDCKDTIIQCKYSMLGCKLSFKRSKLLKHLKEVDHTSFMDEYIDSQCNQLKSLKLQLDDYKKELYESNELIINRMCQNNDFTQIFNKKFTINWIIPDFLSIFNNNNLYKSNELLIKKIDIGQCVFELNLSQNDQDPSFISLELRDLITLSPFNYHYSFYLINKKDISNNKYFELSYKTSFDPHQCINFINLFDLVSIENGWLSNEVINNIEYNNCIEIEFIIEIKSNPNWRNYKF